MDNIVPTINNEELILTGKRESFRSAECLNGHLWDNASDLDDEAFLRMSCPFGGGLFTRCGATLTIQYYKSRIVIPESALNKTGLRTTPNFTEQHNDAQNKPCVSCHCFSSMSNGKMIEGCGCGCHRPPLEPSKRNDFTEQARQLADKQKNATSKGWPDVTFHEAPRPDEVKDNSVIAYRQKIIDRCRELEIKFNWQLTGEVVTGIRQFVEQLPIPIVKDNK